MIMIMIIQSELSKLVLHHMSLQVVPWRNVVVPGRERRPSFFEIEALLI